MSDHAPMYSRRLLSSQSVLTNQYQLKAQSSEHIFLFISKISEYFNKALNRWQCLGNLLILEGTLSRKSTDHFKSQFSGKILQK